MTRGIIRDHPRLHLEAEGDCRGTRFPAGVVYWLATPKKGLGGAISGIPRFKQGESDMGDKGKKDKGKKEQQKKAVLSPKEKRKQKKEKKENTPR